VSVARTGSSRPTAPSLGKLRPPRQGRSFERQRLFDAIDRAAPAPGLWLAAPPGFGKTTLVASYLKASALPTGWLQLDGGDVDVSTLLHYLAEAARAIAPRRRLRLPVPTADDLGDVPALVQRFMRALAGALPAPWVLVLDNLQELGPAPQLHAGLAAALAELGDGMRLIAISREPPPPQYARALANQQLTLIDSTDLRFTAGETQALLELHGRPWSAAQLQRATDGWAAALVLLLAGRTEPAAAGQAGDRAGQQRVFDLIASEVIDALPAGHADALTRIAFLPAAGAAAAVAVSGDAGAGELLAELARRSLFTDRRDTPAPVYTFHALFGAFLRARAADRLTPPQLLALRLQAAQLLAAGGQVDAALAELIAAAAWEPALALLERHAGHFVAQGRTTLVHDALLALPPAWRERPGACYWFAVCELATRPAAALELLQRAHAGFTAAGDPHGSFLAAAAAADAIVFLGASYAALAPWMPVLEAHAPAYLAGRDPALDLRVLPGLLAAFVYRDPGHPLTAPLADAAEAMLDRPLGASQRIVLGTLAYYLLWTGQTPRLDRIMLKIDRLCAGQEGAPATLLRWYGVSVLIRSLLGRVDEALAHAGQALAVARSLPPPLQAKSHLLMVLATLAARDAEAAREHLAAAAGVLGAGNPVDVTTYEFQRGMLMLLDADWAGAAQSMRASVASGRDSGWPLREHIALLGQALAATQVGAWAEAEAALQAALTHRFHAVCRWHHWIAALIEAELALRQGQQPRALAALERAITTGRECGYDFGPMPYCCGDMMARLADLALRHRLDPAFVLHMVRRHRLPAPAAAAPDWPWPVRIRSLGGLAIERDGAPAPTPRKESRKPLELLKLLLARGPAPVPVTRLCARLWPQAEGDAARNSFDNTLHRLRKLLGDDNHLQLRLGGLVLNPAACWTDVGALAHCLDEPVPADTAPEPVATLEPDWVERVLALYAGPFLAGDDELPEVLMTRERLQARLLRAVRERGSWLEAGGQLQAAAGLYGRVLEQQPLAEEIARRLMACLLQQGQRAEALEVFRRCRQQLSVVLGVRPAPETEALAAGLRNL
jgi:LuxR family maltose regulon positive regulatory protein